MTIEEFKASLAKSKPPGSQSPAIVALWWQGRDDWKKAHAIVMGESSRECAWVHAHLHRVEGDLENARYWYRQAERPVATGSLAQEWGDIARALLASKTP
jgi:hypothetical protein